MIFKENIISLNDQNLPIYTNSQQFKSKNLINIDNYNHLTLDINIKNNNRYSLHNNFEMQNDNNFEEEKKNQNKVRTISTSRMMTSENILDKALNRFIAKVELENIRNKNDCIYLLDEYLKNNKLIINYEVSYEQDKMIFYFKDEKAAFEFTKIIYIEKNKNSLYKNVIVHLSLLPNKSYLRKQKLEKRKRGLSYESIIKLYNGTSFIKKPKELPKMKGNINFGIKSPFYNFKHNKKDKNSSLKLLENHNYIRRNDSKGDIFGYIGYDGLPLKNYQKLRISVLDTHYNPFGNFKYRENNKKKWISPSNFKYY